MPLAAQAFAIARQRSFVPVICTEGVDGFKDDSALCGGQNTQLFTIALVSMGRLGTRVVSREGTVEPSSQAPVITLPYMQSAGCTAKPCCWIWVSLPISDKRARVDSFFRTRTLKNYILRFIAKRPKSTPVLGSGVEPDIEIECRDICRIFEMDDQTVAFENSRAVGITTRGKVSPVLLSSVTFIDTDINGLRRNVLLTAILRQRRHCSHKNAMNPAGIPAFPSTFKDLQVADGYLRLKWAAEAAGTDGTEYHCEDRDACAHCHGAL